MKQNWRARRERYLRETGRIERLLREGYLAKLVVVAGRPRA